MKKFEDEMDALIEDTLEMGELTSMMIENSVKALSKGDTELAEDTSNKYRRITQLDSSIENDALRILMLYQPMSSDMRVVATILKIITYLERIGKYSKNIAKAAIFLSTNPSVCSMDGIPAMGEIAVKMVRDAVLAFKNRDISDLHDYSERDTYLDSMRKEVLRENMIHIHEDPSSVDACIYYISVSRYIERVGDHSCKIAEKVTYMVTGKHVEID
ncbi:MAG: phosphate signaling complex protein PhoU [Candidatus Methanomethylophilaceae archaeon]